MLDIIKNSMRITHDRLDSDIQQNIDACLLDLERVGIDVKKDSSLKTKACELYCKWNYDYLGKGEYFQRNYERLRDSLSMSGSFKEA